MFTLNSNTFLIIVGCLGFVTIAGWVMVLSSFDIFSPVRPLKWREGFTAIITGFILLLPFWFIETVRMDRAIINGSEVLHDFTQNTIMWQWRWNSLMSNKNARLVSYGELFADVNIGVHPITENPKVRSFRYFVEIKTRPTIKDRLLLEKEIGKVSNYAGQSGSYLPLAVCVKSMLYEFNEKHSKELAMFYNPLDESQQIEFNKLLVGDVGDKIAQMGAYIVSAKFSLDD